MRNCPTCQQVIRFDIFIGFGSVPFFDIRHTETFEHASNSATVPTRMNAESGYESKLAKGLRSSDGDASVSFIVIYPVAVNDRRNHKKTIFMCTEITEVETDISVYVTFFLRWAVLIQRPPLTNS